MKFRIDKHSGVIEQFYRFRSKIVGIFVLRALISGILTCIVGLFALILVSQHIYSLSNVVLLTSAMPAIVVIIIKYTLLRRDFAHIPAIIDHQLCDNSIVLTCLELSQTENLKTPFFDKICLRAKHVLDKKEFFEFKVVKSPIELVLLIFISLVTVVLIITQQSSQNIIEKPGFDKNIIAQVAELEAIASINQDTKLLKLLTETKNKLINNEFNSLTSMFLEIDEKINAREKNREQISDFIEKSDESMQTDKELLKKAFELAQKSLELRKSADIVEKEKQQLIHLDLDEILKILRKNLMDDELLMKKLNAFIKKNKSTNNDDDSNTVAEKNDSNKGDEFEQGNWVFSTAKPAKVQIISKSDTTSIIDFNAITEQFSDFEHNELRKRIVAELNKNE